MIKSMVSYNFTISQLKPCYKSLILPSNPAGLSLAISTRQNQRFNHLNIISWRVQRNDKKTKRKFAVCNSTQPGGPLPSAPPSGSCWKGWVLGIVITIIAPFVVSKWGSFLKIKNGIETVIETVEHVADGVEKVAERVERVAEEIADDLPAGNLKNVAALVERLAERTADDAQHVDDFIDKVQDVDERVENFVESIEGEEREISKEASVKDEAKGDK